ncbi:MAG: YjbQ family protein [Chloroflexi bacterium]|nr:YjbQ family protein [Chloroflexota bacterium]
MVKSETIRVQSKGFCDIVDVTSQIRQHVAASSVRTGFVVVFVAGSTTGVTTIEYEPGLIADLKAAFDRLVPTNIPYKHDATWGDGNGFAHVRASLLGPSLSVPIVGGALALGTWQQIVVIDFDNRPRRRDVLIQISGDL